MVTCLYMWRGVVSGHIARWEFIMRMLPERMIVRYKLHSKEDFIDEYWKKINSSQLYSLRIRAGNSISYPILQHKANTGSNSSHSKVLLHNGEFCNRCITQWCLQNSLNMSHWHNELVSRLLYNQRWKWKTVYSFCHVLNNISSLMKGKLIQKQIPFCDVRVSGSTVK